ncbi:unnamed protein product [Diabrotica balteata]|uniref:TTF-type domain-containing protein n=1 Tax=Diabrotica balteata TaxID=107213 RepID=A0A9N9XI30_DIABA|nr:unnamed protein product [Diabrotica balteata]
MDKFVIKQPRLNPELESKVDDATKKKLLENPWSPDFKFKFPSSGPRNLKFQMRWLSDWNWLVYSPAMDAAFCKFCALFSTVVGEKGSSAGKLVKIPFRKWKDAREDFKKHSENSYHKKCLEKAANFLATYSGEKDNIQLMLNKGRKFQIEKNRESLKPIIKTAIFLAKMVQSFRGHRDFGPFDFNAPLQRGEGNFRSLLKFRMDSGDDILTNHLKTARQIRAEAESGKIKKIVCNKMDSRHDSVNAFISLLPVIIKALDVITNWSDNKTATDAQLLSAAICKCDFLLSLFVVNSVFELTLPLSKYLQTENLDLRLAVESADKTKESLEQLRQNADETFTNIFGQVSALCDEFGVNMSLPRTVIYKTKRNNVPASTPEEYYRRSVFIPFFDEIIQSINDRFVAHKEILKPFQDLLSAQYDKTIGKSFQNLVHFYGLDDTNIKGEIILWKQFLKDLQHKPTPKNALEALDTCNKNLFPLVYNLLLIMATLPVTTCTCERSFSSLKILKTYLRNCTSEERLNGLALMFIHQDIQIDEEEVLNHLAKKQRRLDILL